MSGAQRLLAAPDFGDRVAQYPEQRTPQRMPLGEAMAGRRQEAASVRSWIGIGTGWLA